MDYALRAIVELASATGDPDKPITADTLAQAQGIPPKFLESILLQLRRGGVVNAQRGPDGGYWLARPAADISLADVIRVIDGPLANIRGHRPDVHPDRPAHRHRCPGGAAPPRGRVTD